MFFFIFFVLGGFLHVLEHPELILKKFYFSIFRKKSEKIEKKSEKIDSKFFKPSHATIQTIIFRTCGRISLYYLWFSQTKLCKI